MSILWKILDHFFLLRPTLFFPLWTVVLAGRLNAGSEAPIIPLFLWFAALMGASYTINQIVDIEGDQKNHKLFLIAETLIDRRVAVILSGILTVVGIFGLLQLGIAFGILGLIFFVVTGIFYNLKPWRWKDKPVAGILVSLAGGAIAFFIGCLPVFNLELVWKSIPYLSAFGAVAALTTVPDMEGDKNSGKDTLALHYGLEFTTIASAILCILSALLAWWTQDRLIFWPALLSSPVFIYAIFSKSRESVILAIKFSIFLLSLAVGLRYIGYLVLMALYFFAARWYYRRRFNIEYPSFKPE